MPRARALLEVEGLTVRYQVAGEPVEALRGIDLRLNAGDSLGLVGRSGSGKSSLGLALMGLLPPSASLGGRLFLDGEDLLTLSSAARRERCGRVVAMVFQEPAMALNPVMRIQAQVVEALRRRQGWQRKDEKDGVEESLEQVGLPAEIGAAYPHQLSGGQRQRVLIAMAIAPRPRLLIADEPTTALDVLTEAGILELLLTLRRSLGIAVLMVSHDLRAVGRLCARALVLDGGRVVGERPLGELIEEAALNG
ncbi:MAG: ABC transporter ATP-binding protein [Deltaproteobacteria bacterium]|nr:ABC transporter ATP-binding protein [Deltaproteobacteria bacterium]